MFYRKLEEKGHGKEENKYGVGPYSRNLVPKDKSNDKSINMDFVSIDCDNEVLISLS